MYARSPANATLRLEAQAKRRDNGEGQPTMSVILVVEDDVFIQDMAESMIGDWGYDILSACDVPEAMVHLRSGCPIDAIFTDVNLKDEALGGCDVARRGILLRPGLRVLYITATRDPGTMRARFSAGTHFLPKPYTEQQLNASVQNLFAHEGSAPWPL
jgi:CheY-like chemotaxis protein